MGYAIYGGLPQRDGSNPEVLRPVYFHQYIIQPTTL